MSEDGEVGAVVMFSLDLEVVDAIRSAMQKAGREEAQRWTAAGHLDSPDIVPSLVIASLRTTGALLAGAAEALPQRYPALKTFVATAGWQVVCDIEQTMLAVPKDMLH